MAPLTWREVAAPSFSGVTESQRLAGQMLSGGFDSAIGALGKFGTAQKDSTNGELLSRMAGYGNDHAALVSAMKSGTILDGLNRGYVTADALNFGFGREADVLANDQTRVKTTGFELDNVQTGVRTQGLRLDNNNQSMANDQLAWSNANTRAFEAARPAAVDLTNKIRSAAALGTPEGRAEASRLQAEGSAVFAAAGWTPDDVNGQINGNMETNTTGIGLNTDLRAQGDAVLAHNQDTAAQELYTQVIKVGDAEEAARIVRSDPNLDPTVAAKTLGLLGSEQTQLLSGPDVNPATYQLEQRMGGAATAGPAPIEPSARKEILDAALNAKGDLSYDQNQTLIEQSVGLTNRAASIMDAMEMDGLFGSGALAETLLDPNLASESQAETKKRLAEALGGDLDIDSPELIANINHVVERYGVSTGQAGVILQNAIRQNLFGTRWLMGETDIDYSKLDEMVGTVYNKDGKTKGERFRPGIEAREHFREKQGATESLRQDQEALAQAQQRYFNLRDRSKNNPGLKPALEKAQMHYQALLGQMERTANRIDSNPDIGFNAGR